MGDFRGRRRCASDFRVLFIEDKELKQTIAHPSLLSLICSAPTSLQGRTKKKIKRKGKLGREDAQRRATTNEDITRERRDKCLRRGPRTVMMESYIHLLLSIMDRIAYDLLKAVPISVYKILIVAVVSQVPLSDKLSLPVEQPLLAPEPPSGRFSNELKPLGSEPVVSSTLVIIFDRSKEDGGGCSSKELELGSERTISPTSVIVFEDRAA